MVLTYLPGQPNQGIQTACQGVWREHLIFAYCTGNNLAILSKNYGRLQTIYLPTDCVAVDLNSTNGYIAVAFGNRVNVYRPQFEVMKEPKWIFCCEIFHDDSAVNSLKWGAASDIVLGSLYLSLWKVLDEYGVYKPILQWTKRQPRPIYFCSISDDSQLICSYAKFDRLLKLWSKASVDRDQVWFDLTLLLHEGAITMARWRKVSSTEKDKKEEHTHILYTLSDDKKMRVWSCYEYNSANMAHTCCTIDLGVRYSYAMTIDRCIVENYVKDSKELTRTTNSDITLLIKDSGKIDIYALSQLSEGNNGIIKPIKIGSKEFGAGTFPSESGILYFSEFQCTVLNNIISTTILDASSGIRHITINLADLFNEKITYIGILDDMLTGHNKSIKSLIRSSDGEALMTTTRFTENSVWCPQTLHKGVTLKLKWNLITDVPVKMAVVLERGNLIICYLINHTLQAWECRFVNDEQTTPRLGKLKHAIKIEEESEYPEIIFNTPESKHNHDRHYISLVFINGTVLNYMISSEFGFRKLESSHLNLTDCKIYKLSTIDPVHPTFSTSRALFSLITEDGQLIAYKANIISESGIDWIQVCLVETGIKNARSFKGSSFQKMCVVNSDGHLLNIWDLESGVLEYEEQFDEKIEDIDWTSTELGQSVVSVGFKGYALLYTQLRYDYTSSVPPYMAIEKIDISLNTDRSIGDSIWLKNGTFVVASGNQFYIKGRKLDPNDPFTRKSIGSRILLADDLFHLSNVLNGPIPIYHPQFIVQAIYMNKIEFVKEILIKLLIELKNFNFRSEDNIDIDSTLEIDVERILISNDQNYPQAIYSDIYSEINSTLIGQLCELLTKISLPYLTRHQQGTLVTIIEAFKEILANRKTLDVNGLRFLLGVKLFKSHKHIQGELLSRDISWALHSENKEILLAYLNSDIISWNDAKQHKIAYWATESDLRTKFEAIAKYEYSKDNTKDPNACSLFYLALHKRNVLVSLWKVSYSHPEQQKMLKFLAHDFKEPRWRKAALKNAFVLISKHRYLDAACFFLLADSLKDCVNVVFKQMQDLDLAIAICRVYENDNGPVLQSFLVSQCLGTSIEQNNRWMISFIYWKMKKRNLAIKALISNSLELLDFSINTPIKKQIKKTYYVEDPALLYLYDYLRYKNIDYYLSSLDIGHAVEFEVVKRVNNILCRMGCEYLALSLVKNWRFIKREEYLTSKGPKRKSTTTEEFDSSEIPNTVRVRESLFDKFNKSGERIDFTKHSNQTPSSATNMLSEFYEPQPKVNSSMTVTDEKINKKSKVNLTNTAVNIRNDNNRDLKDVASSVQETVNAENAIEKTEGTKKKAEEKPRNLLDDFMF